MYTHNPVKQLTALIAIVSAIAQVPLSQVHALPPRPTRPANAKAVIATPVATPAPVADPLPALQTCASDIYGLSLSYTKTGGLTGQIARSLSLPSSISGAVQADATGVYGIAGQTVEAVVYGSGTGSNTDVSVAVSKASLCSVQMPYAAAWPANSADALAALKATYPGLPQNISYQASTKSNSYIFTATTTHPVKGTGELTTQAIALSMTRARNGKIVLSAISGTGTYASQAL